MEDTVLADGDHVGFWACPVQPRLRRAGDLEVDGASLQSSNAGVRTPARAQWPANVIRSNRRILAQSADGLRIQNVAGGCSSCIADVASVVEVTDGSGHASFAPAAGLP